MARIIMDDHRFHHLNINDLADTPFTALADKADKVTLEEPGMDAADLRLYDPRPCWVITNPPFTEASRIAHCALEHATEGVALLLRCTFLEPTQGRAWLVRRPPTAILALPRISFTGEGVDTAPTWWFVWSRRAAGGIYVMSRETAAGQLCLAK